MTAEELLMSDEIEVFQYSNVIEIDGQSRVISVPLGEDMFGVEGDKNVTLKHFTCPKIVGNNIEIDLSEHNLYANYTLADEKGNPKSEDVIQSPCENIVIGDDNITFDWKISEWVTREDGFIAFSIVAKKSVDGLLETRWYTTPAVGKIRKTVKEGRYLEQQYPDVIDNLMNRVSDLERILANGGGTGGSIVVDDALSETSTNPVQNKVVAKEIRQLSEDIDNIVQTKIISTSLTWESGAWNVDTGKKSLGADFIRTIDKHNVVGCHTAVITVPSVSSLNSEATHGYVLILGWDRNNNYLGYKRAQNGGNEPIIEVEIDISEYSYIALTCRFGSSSSTAFKDITPEYGVDFGLSLKNMNVLIDEDTTIIRKKGGLPESCDLNDIIEQGVWYGPSPNTFTNVPFNNDEAFHMEVIINGSVISQYIDNLRTAKRYTRYKVGDQYWQNWRASDNHDRASRYYAFGDSTTYGQIAVVGGQSKYNYPACVGKILNMTVLNKGKGGQGLLKDWDEIHTDYINKLNMSDAKLITVGWAYNDATLYKEINFGSYDDTSDSTFVGKYFTIMKEFQEKCPNAMVILITGYGSSIVGEHFTYQYTFADGSKKSVKDMYDELEKMCHLHGWCCINQSKGTWVNEFNWTHMIGDNIHPTDEGYLRYGNYMSAKIASLYSNLWAW